MARRKAITVEQAVLDGFEGTRNHGAFQQMSDERYIGYVSAVVNINNPSLDVVCTTIQETVERLLAEGKLS